jgi:inorganic triphosphatase YgiF
MPSAHADVGDARVAKMSRYGVLAPEAPVHILGGAIVGRLVTEVLAQAPEVMAGSDPEATHDMRVAIRRLRNALDTFGPPHHGARARRFAKAARRLGKRLGAVRDADVQLAALRRISASAADDEIAGIAFAIESLERRRAGDLASVPSAIDKFARLRPAGEAPA